MNSMKGWISPYHYLVFGYSNQKWSRKSKKSSQKWKREFLNWKKFLNNIIEGKSVGKG
jgi:hypothetical protein